MGRSRAIPPQSAYEDSNQSRSKRKKSAANVEAPSPAKASSESKPGLYHCNYCNKDVSGMVRFRCAVCPDYDLCVECFTVGAEVKPHKSSHPYRIMDNLSFPLLSPDWNADEEILLLEGIGMHGFGNWNEVADHVVTKSKSQCIDHYNAIYMNSPCFPLPDLSHLVGKSREEILAMAQEDGIKKEGSMVGELCLKEESPVSTKIKQEVPTKNFAQQDISNMSGEVSSYNGLSSGSKFSSTVKKVSSVAQVKDGVKVEETQSDRSIGEKKPRFSFDERPSMTELSGYNGKRQEFEIEYDNDAEQLLADMEFKDTDTDAERELKLRVLHIYSKRLDERKRRKDFILERNLLWPNAFERNLSPEERVIYQRYKVFMRFLSKDEHEELIKSVIEEHRIIRRIQDLQEARAAGCRTTLEENKFIEEKKKKMKEAEEVAERMKESAQAGPSGKAPVHGSSPRAVLKSSLAVQPFTKDTLCPTISNVLDDWDISDFPGADLLSDTEKQLCVELRLLPAHYLSMLQSLSTEVLKGNVSKKSDAYNLFRVESGKVDRIYDMLVKKGIAKA